MQNQCTSKRAEQKLAPELWHMIASLLRSDRQSISRFSQVSRILQHIARPYFYRELIVCAKENTATLQLLARNAELAKVVVSLRVTMPPIPRWNHQDGRPFPKVTNVAVLNAIFKMSSLKNLVMIGSIFSFASEQQLFLDHLKARKKPLRSLAFREDPDTQLLPGDQFPLPGLTGLSWDSHRGDSVGYYVLNDGHFWIAFLQNLGSILEASAGTLKHVSLPFINSKEPVLRRLWKARLPSLRVLQLGDVQFEPNDATTSFAQFLVHHPTIEELHFRNDKEAMYRFRRNPSFHLTEKLLPKLKEFRGNTHVFLQLALVRPKSFEKTLHRLELIPNGKREAATLIEMFTALVPDMNHPPPFPVLKELLLDLTDWVKLRPTDLCGLISWWARCCGQSLEVWLGGLPPVPITSTILGNVFKAFPKLRVIHLCEKVIKGDEDPEEETEAEYVANLGAMLPKLEKVVILEHKILRVITGWRDVIDCSKPKCTHIIRH